MCHNPQAVVQVNGRRSRRIRDRAFGPAGLPPVSSLLYVLALEPLLRRLRDEGTSPALRGVPFAGPLTARVSAFADDITVFVSRRLDIKTVKEAVVEYERIAGAKVNFDKSEGLRLGAWRGSNTLPGPFRWSDVPVRILGVWFGPDLSPTGAKLVGRTNQGEYSGGNLAFKEVVLKGQGRGVRHVRLTPDPLPIGCTSSA